MLNRWLRPICCILLLSLFVQMIAPIGTVWLAGQLADRLERTQGLADEAGSIISWLRDIEQNGASTVWASDVSPDSLDSTTTNIPLFHDPGDTSAESQDEDDCNSGHDCGSEVQYDNRALLLKESIGATGLPLVMSYNSRYENVPIALATWIPTTQAIENWSISIQGWTFEGKGAQPLAFWDATNKKTGQPVPSGVYYYENTYGNQLGKGSTTRPVVVKRAEDGPLGYNRVHNYQARIVKIDDKNVLLQASGIWKIFSRKSGNIYEANDPAEGQLLKQDNGGWQWRRTGADGSGISGVLKYDPDGKLIAFVDYLGNQTSLFYDDQGKLTRVTDPIGQSTTFEYDGIHISKITDAAGVSWSLAYGNNDLTTIVDPLGNAWRYEYDNNHRLVQRQDALGQTTHYDYDQNGGISKVTDAVGNTVTFETIYQQEPYLVDDPSLSRPNLGYTTVVHRSLDENETARHKYAFDEAGRITLHELSFDKGATTRSWRYTYARDKDGGQLQSVTDSDGNETKYSYQANTALVTKIESSTGNEIDFRYKHISPSTSAETPGRWVLASFWKDDWNKTELTYDEKGLPRQVKQGVLSYWLVPKEADGSIPGLTAAMVWNWDGKGDPSASSEAKTLRYEYDSKGHVTATSDQIGRRTSYTYDSAGRLIQLTDAQGRKASFFYDALGRMTRQVDAAGGETSYTFDAIGNLVAIQDAKGNKTTLKYDHKNRLVERRDALGRTLSYGYDNEGRLTWREDARGARVQFSYDPQERLSLITFPTGETWDFVYDSSGLIVKAANQEAVWTFMHDKQGRVTTATIQRGKWQASLSYKYDQSDQITSVETSDGFTLKYTYGGSGELTRITSPLGQVEFKYDTKQQLTPRLTEINSNDVTLQLRYDNTDRLEELDYHHRLWTKDKFVSYHYSYDSADNIISREAPGGTTNYEYDALDRLVGVTNPDGSKESYTYDAVGNRTQKTTSQGTIDYTYDAANQLLTAGNKHYSYDANGHLIGMWQDQQGQVYSWDYQGRLKAVSQRNTETLPFPLSLAESNPTQSQPLATYAYDALGQQVGEQNRQFLVDRNHVLAEYDTEGKATQQSVYGSGWDSLQITGLETKNNSQSPLTDGIGTVDGAITFKGETNLTTQYDAWGTPTSWDNTSTLPGFQGRPYDSSTGLYQFRDRFYDPELGRFISPDPLSVPMLTGTLNGYTFGMDNPLRFTDPTGQIVPIIAAIIIGAAFGAAFAAAYHSASYAFNTSSNCFSYSEFFYRMGTGALVGGAVGGLGGAIGIGLAGLSPLAAVGAGMVSGAGLGALESVATQLIIERKDSVNSTDVLISAGAGAIGGGMGAGASQFIGAAISKDIGTELVMTLASNKELAQATSFAVLESFVSKPFEQWLTGGAKEYQNASDDFQQ